MTSFGLGPLPGTSLKQAADIVLSETPLPNIPQLPDRGLGSDDIGRTAALLPIHVDRGPRSWIVTKRPQLWTRRAADMMERDLDNLEELWAGTITSLKVQLVGPWTLAAAIEMPNGHRMITDRGALEDITAALDHALADHVSNVCRRFDLAPDAITIQLDEPLLPEITTGSLAGTTRYDTISAIHPNDVLQRLDRFGPHLLHTTAPLFQAPYITVDLASIATHGLLDEAGVALGSGKRWAIAPMEPKRVGVFVDKLQIDPVETKLDVHAQPAATLGEAAKNYKRARECDEILQRDFLS